MLFERLQSFLGARSSKARRKGKNGRATAAKKGPTGYRRLRLETLEDRTVPTVLFAPQFGNETTLRDGGQRINSPNVYVVLWGHSWGGLNSANSQSVFNATSGVLANHYLDGLSQYGVTTNAHYKKLVFDDTPDPASGFSEQSMKDEIGRLVQAGQLPNPFFTANIIVDMVTAPGIKSGAAAPRGTTTSA